MPLLFSYGTLQEEDVQLSTFGRRLHGQRDELPGFEPSLVRIEDPQEAAETGRTHHANVTRNGRQDSRVGGTVFEITDAELAAADAYEQPAAYTRVTARLASGKEAWVYFHAGSLQDQTERNKALVRRWIAFADAGFPGPLADFIAADYVGHLGEMHMDVAELERLERAFARSFPDAQRSIDDILAEADRVVLRVTSRATHRGEFQGIAPTGRRVEFTAIVIYRIAGERIAESWGELDFLRLMRQLRAPG
jgi:predicted ester cyclase